MSSRAYYIGNFYKRIGDICFNIKPEGRMFRSLQKLNIGKFRYNRKYVYHDEKWFYYTKI